MQKGDFVYISYVGRIKESGEIFDLTDETLAKKERVYNPKVKYGDVPVIVGAGLTLPGIDDALLEMKVGERKRIDIPPQKAFGERKEELVKLLPISIFKQRGIEPIPGRYVSINRINGKIVSSNGGRVKVDFNHPLAGKTLVYDLEVKCLVKEPLEKVFAVVKYFTGLDRDKVSVSLGDSTAEIETKEMSVARELRNAIARIALEWIKEIEKIKFVEVYERKP